MDFDVFIQIVLGLGALVFWMFGASKKQRKPNGDQPEGEPPVPGSLPELTETEKLIREALGIVDDRSPSVEPVTQREPEPVPKTTSRARVTSEPVNRIVDPLSYKEAKAEKRHVRFHEKYDQQEMPVKQSPPKVKDRLGLEAGSIRSAIVWREILGPPKSLE